MELALTKFLLIMLGGSLGSFASVLIYRLPRSHESITILKPNSFCPKCKHRLKIIHLIPFLGFLLHKGKCFACNTRISPIYLVNEVTIACFLMFFINQLGVNNLFAWVLVALIFILYVQALMDLQTLLLSQPLNIFILVIGLSLNLSQEFFTIRLDALLGLVFGYGLLFSINLLHRLIRKENGIGEGDFLLLGGIGATFGASAIGPILLIGSSITLLLYTLQRKKSKELPLGFGLSIGGITYCTLFVIISTT